MFGFGLAECWVVEQMNEAREQQKQIQTMEWEGRPYYPQDEEDDDKDL